MQLLHENLRNIEKEKTALVDRLRSDEKCHNNRCYSINRKKFFIKPGRNKRSGKTQKILTKKFS